VRTQLAAQIASELREQIIAGEWAPGEAMPSHLLSAAFDVSHIPIREALVMLASEGFLTLRPNRKPVVAEPTVQSTRDKLDVLRSLAGLAAELACTKASDEELAELRQVQRDMERAFRDRDVARYHELNQRSHAFVVRAARNEALQGFHDSLTRHLEWARTLSKIRTDVLRHAPEEHSQIIEALERRDAVAAREITERHYETVSTAILNGLEKLSAKKPGRAARRA
jgi:DNA-binding GntR family transcriptional regulator